MIRIKYYGQEMELTRNGFLMGCFMFILHVALLVLSLDISFETRSEMIFYVYLCGCIWAQAYLYSITEYLQEDEAFIFRGTLYTTMFIFTPAIFLWVKMRRT